MKTCSSVGCCKTARAKGLCGTHYLTQWRRLRGVRPIAERKGCAAGDCVRPADIRGLCKMHHRANKRRAAGVKQRNLHSECTVPGCGGKHSCRSLCHRHYIAVRKYGLSPEALAGLIERQSGACAICRLPPQRRALSIDHCHKSGEIRGLLCERCNLAIGHLRDSPDLADVAAAYLRGR